MAKVELNLYAGAATEVAGKNSLEINLSAGLSTDVAGQKSFELVTPPVGIDALSAYQSAVSNGFVGSESEWLLSLKGANGVNGLSAYQTAVSNGFVGSESEWLTSLKGSNGSAGAGTFIFQQNVPSEVWIITHDLWKMPSVTVVDSGGSTVEGDIKYDSELQVTVTFSAPFSGVAYLN